MLGEHRLCKPDGAEPDPWTEIQLWSGNMALLCWRCVSDGAPGCLSAPVADDSTSAEGQEWAGCTTWAGSTCVSIPSLSSLPGYPVLIL